MAACAHTDQAGRGAAGRMLIPPLLAFYLCKKKNLSPFILDCAAGRHVNFSIPEEAADRSDGTPRR